MEALVVSMDRGADDPIDTIGRGRLDRKLATPRFEEHGKLIRCRLDRRHLISKPLLEQLAVGDGRLPEACQGADLGPMTLPCSTGPIIPIMVIGLHAETRAGDVVVVSRRSTGSRARRVTCSKLPNGSGMPKPVYGRCISLGPTRHRRRGAWCLRCLRRHR